MIINFKTDLGAWGVYFYDDDSEPASSGSKSGNWEVRAVFAF